MSDTTVKIYTDGACSGNPGPGGWGVVLLYGEHEKQISGGERETTNNRMELTAVIEALSLLKRPCKVRRRQRDQGLGLRLEETGLEKERRQARHQRRFVGKTLAAAANP